MQQDKFDRAAACIQSEEASTSSSTTVESPDYIIMSPAGKRKGSATYWKAKFEQSQALIRDMAKVSS